MAMSKTMKDFSNKMRKVINASTDPLQESHPDDTISMAHLKTVSDSILCSMLYGVNTMFMEMSERASNERRLSEVKELELSVLNQLRDTRQHHDSVAAALRDELSIAQTDFLKMQDYALTVQKALATYKMPLPPWPTFHGSQFQNQGSSSSSRPANSQEMEVDNAPVIDTPPCINSGD